MKAVPSWKLSAAVAIVASASITAGVLLLSVTTALAQPAPNARPTGGTVVAGQATISFGPGVVYITSTSTQAVIDWQSFDIGAKQQVVFTGPSASATVLNRVTGPNPSQIAGSLNSNGQVYLVNGSGAAYYQGAQVDVLGFVSTSANIADANFMAGNLKFDGAGSANALIENQGEIKVSGGGSLVLIAPGVSNSGVLRTPLGHINLLSAITFTLVLSGDGLMSLDVTNQLISSIRSDLVVNTGTIRARGGVVQLGGRVAPGVVGSIRVGGVVRARTANSQPGPAYGQPGEIAVGGVGPSVVVTGTLDASGTQEAGDVGGSIQVDNSSSIELAATSVVDVQGEAGGGTAAIGTTLARAKGGPGTLSALTSNTVLIDQGAQISASGLAAGNGGRVTVLSAGATQMNGTITATGGNLGGNGGFVETSSIGVLTVQGSVNLTAPAGTEGTWLLDPFDFIITRPVANALSAQLFTGKGGKLVIRADHDIEVDAAIDGRGGIPGTQLIFNAGHQVRFNADVFTNNAPIEVDVGAGGVLASP